MNPSLAVYLENIVELMDKFKPRSSYYHVGIITQDPEVRYCCLIVLGAWSGTGFLTSGILIWNAHEHPHLEHRIKATPLSRNYTELLSYEVPSKSPIMN